MIAHRTLRQLLRPGETNLVSLARHDVHGFVAGTEGAEGLDLTTRLDDRRATPYLVFEDDDEGAERRTGRWVRE